MTEFLLNDKLIKTNAPEGMVLLDFIREHKKLKGTKSACREGDCGSCTILIGSLENSFVKYQAITSCITPLGNVHKKHVVTIEGLNNSVISPIQQAMIDTAAIQCGYCTPGIVLSLTAYVLANSTYEFNAAINAVGGNICRCTGYKSIERAVQQLVNELSLQGIKGEVDKLVAHAYVPTYFKEISAKLSKIKDRSSNGSQVIGGGTDLYVQRPDEMYEASARLVADDPLLTKIIIDGNECRLGAACKISDLLKNELLTKAIPALERAIGFIASDLIRNIATLAGNLVNASPIGDLSILFLALDADLELESANKQLRKIKLNQFFKKYKDVDLKNEEIVKSIIFELPSSNALFNFEKVSKRKYLDIASVNTAILLKMDEDKILKAHISIGGVAAIPLYLRKTCNVLEGKQLNDNLIHAAAKALEDEITPISDVRGSAEYKNLLARQLFYAHFNVLFPEIFKHVEIEK